MTPNERAFLDMIAVSEIGPALLAKSDNGYNVLVGATPKKPLLFSGYSKHPGILNKALNSTAAGRYQLLFRYWKHYSKLLGRPDFTPETQDLIALQQIREFKALDMVKAGRFQEALEKVSKLWASLPGAGYGQHENSYDKLLAAYLKAGGELA